MIFIYYDKQNLYDENFTAATAVSANVLDGGAGGEAYAALFLAVTANPALTAAQTLTVEVQTAGEENFVAPVSLATFHAQTGKTLALGTRFPRGALRYTRLKYTVASTSGYAGKLTAGLVPDIDTSV